MRQGVENGQTGVDPEDLAALRRIVDRLEALPVDHPDAVEVRRATAGVYKRVKQLRRRAAREAVVANDALFGTNARPVRVSAGGSLTIQSAAARLLGPLTLAGGVLDKFGRQFQALFLHPLLENAVAAGFQVFTNVLDEITVADKRFDAPPIAATAERTVGVHHHVSELGREGGVVTGAQLPVHDHACAHAHVADFEEDHVAEVR